MRIKARELVFLLVFSLVALTVSSQSLTVDHSDLPQAERLPKADKGRFFVRLITLESGSSPLFIAYLKDCYLPVWQELRSTGIVSSLSVFELSINDSMTTSTSKGEYLVLTELSSPAKPNDLIDAEKASECSFSRDIPGFSVLRSTYMSCTPNACFGMPDPAYKNGGSQLRYLVELIGVEDTPVSLAKYRELVSKFFGPANGVLVEKGMIHCFVALENIEVLTTSPGVVPWNQVHISDEWEANSELDWDSIYVELFRSEFSCELDSVWAEIPPTDNVRVYSQGRLIPQLCVR